METQLAQRSCTFGDDFAKDLKNPLPLPAANMTFKQRSDSWEWETPRCPKLGDK